MCECYSADLVSRLDALIKEFHDFSAESVKNLSELDTKINDLYHIIEYVPLDAVKASKVLKELKKSLNERRRWKDCNANLSASLHKLNGVDPSIYEKRVAVTEERNAKYLQESLESYQKHFG